MSETDEKKKLLEAMNQDEEKERAAAKEVLTQFANLKLRVHVVNPADPKGTGIQVKARPLKDFEITQYQRELEFINPALRSAEDSSKVNLTPNELDALHELCDKYISATTGLSVAFLKNLGDNRIRYQLWLGIMKGSNPSKEQLETISKFRGDK